MKDLAKLMYAVLPLCLAAGSARADDPAWYVGKYYDPDNPASSTGFTTGYRLYRTIGCPGRALLDNPCKVPPRPMPVAKAPEPAPVVVVVAPEPPPAPAPVVVAPDPVPAPAPVVVEAPKPPPLLSRETPLVLKDVNFRFNHYDLLPSAYPILDQAAAELKAAHYPKVKVDGYTDDIGTAKYNLWLSDERADTVKRYLAKQGVPFDTLVAQGYGKTDFVATNKTREGRFENRRVELRLE